MKYLLAIAVVLCLTGCATSSDLQSTNQNKIITVFYPDGIVYVE